MAGQINIAGTSGSVQLFGNDTIVTDINIYFPPAGGLLFANGNALEATTGTFSERVDVTSPQGLYVDGRITVGSDNAGEGGVEDGIRLKYTGQAFLSAAESTNLISCYTTGNSTPTATITGAGSANFTGDIKAGEFVTLTAPSVNDYNDNSAVTIQALAHEANVNREGNSRSYDVVGMPGPNSADAQMVVYLMGVKTYGTSNDGGAVMYVIICWGSDTANIQLTPLAFQTVGVNPSINVTRTRNPDGGRDQLTIGGNNNSIIQDANIIRMA